MSALFAYFEFSAFKLAILPVVAFALVYAASRHERPETILRHAFKVLLWTVAATAVFYILLRRFT
ncbi:MAG: hypothetical protein IJG83_08110 [Thermoguttaceae bacterium]|nr:hypothetical protein [Thermoguttaceae bacterium]MBO7722213.1 hypothetical protein [Thermoguttaceae bacterium]MBQ2682397.1 hypothetical protein [Thermoguttaceae bacterium]MBQ3333371.1 hypothetical protein [Thermoguttaceae bacterium]MBQ3453970.1 hypothetical protein [Thermoguttaceae bacterium]